MLVNTCAGCPNSLKSKRGRPNQKKQERLLPDPADSQTKNLRKKSAALSIGAANRKVGKIMVNFLMKIVSFFLPQGDVSVSESDLRTYITILQGYIIFILLAIAAVIVVMIVSVVAVGAMNVGLLGHYLITLE